LNASKVDDVERNGDKLSMEAALSVEDFEVTVGSACTQADSSRETELSILIAALEPG